MGAKYLVLAAVVACFWFATKDDLEGPLDTLFLVAFLAVMLVGGLLVIWRAEACDQLYAQLGRDTAQFDLLAPAGCQPDPDPAGGSE